MKYHIILIIVTMITGIVNANAQDIKSNLSKVRASFYQEEKQCIELEYQLFESEERNKLVEQTQNTLVKNGSIMYSKLLQIESIMTTDYVVRVDHEDRYILIDEMQPFFEMESLINENMDSLLLYAQDWMSVNETEEETSYIFNPPYGKYRQIGLSHNKNDFRITKLSYVFRDEIEVERVLRSPLLEIKFTYKENFDYSSYEQNLFDKYIIASNEGFLPSDEFKNYEFINLLEQ